MQNIHYFFFLIFILIQINGVINWSCNNNQIIEDYLLCDGNLDCSDGSDEIFENCIHRKCGRLRCAYGGCITDLKKQCDGIKDCWDNTDENEFLCASEQHNIPLKKQLRLQIRGDCRNAQFECKTTKQCIKRALTCNGHPDCEDHSDETAELCSFVICPSYSFKCAYGGCIAGASRCNDKNDCIDGSDEADLLCNRTRLEPELPTLPIPLPIPRLKPLHPIFTTLPPNIEGCQIPTDRTNLISFNFILEINQSLGDIISDSQILSFSCPPSYYLLGVNQTYCDETIWNDPIPQCTKYCDETEINRGVSTVAYCRHKGMAVKCKDIQPGYVAEITCANQFEKPRTRTMPWYETLTCGDDYRWNHPRSPCEMKCGQTPPLATKFTLGGHDVSVTDVPWHVGVYSNFDNKRYVRQCAGAIITPYLVVTAAHCFWDTATQTFYDASIYSIAAGKYYSDYNNENDSLVQKSSIQQIITKVYTDRDGDFLNDLALVVLDTPLHFTEAVRPVCQKYSIRTNRTGYVAGWSSDGKGVLKQVDMRILSFEACETYFIDNNIEHPLQKDKFCGLVTSVNDTLCKGDSGGGFYIKETFDRVSQHKLVGIVSHSPYSEVNCAKFGLVVFTDLSHFETWIDEHYNNYYEVV